MNSSNSGSSGRQSKEFIPEKISIQPQQRRGRRRGDGNEPDSSEQPNNGGNTSSSNNNVSRSRNEPNSSSAISSSVVFHEDCELFDELDALDPHAHEGGKVVTNPNPSSSMTTTSYSRSDSSGALHSSRPRSDSNLSSSRSYLANSLIASLQNSSLYGSTSTSRLPTDVDSLIASSNDGTLAEIIAGIEDRYKRSTTLSMASRQQSSAYNGAYNNNTGGESLQFDNSTNNTTVGGIGKRESIVGGKPVSEMTFQERRELLAPERSEGSLDAGGIGVDNGARGGGKGGTLDDGHVIVSSVDWSSLSKSCKRAKNAFRDADSGQMVVKNMFMTHLRPLAGVLTFYAKWYCGTQHSNSGKHCTLDDIKARTTDTKRALRFALACLAPPMVDDDKEGLDDSGDTRESQQVEIERYRIARRYRQELQEAAVGFSSHLAPCDGLQFPLVEIILADDSISSLEYTTKSSQYNGKRSATLSAIAREKQTVRVLAARMLCNLVTDNPTAAMTVLSDVPFSPSRELLEARMSELVLDSSREQSPTNGGDVDRDNEQIFWSDLIAATAKQAQSASNSAASSHARAILGDYDKSDDREALAAVAAALHNLLTSLEAREALLELEDEMKRREDSKQRRERKRRQQQQQRGKASRHDSLYDDNDSDVSDDRPIDVGFDVATNATLLNSLLRVILPAKAVLAQSQLEKERLEPTRPKFKPPTSASEDMSDSATEWISLVLERLASRGLLPNMLRSAGGTTSKSVTPEQVVLVSCIRQAVDDYHSAITPSGETGGFGRRRLSIAAKTAGMTVSTRPHPLWGRADPGAATSAGGGGGRSPQVRDSRTAVPVLLSLANEAEEFRLRVKELRDGSTEAMYDGEANCTIRIIDDLCDILAQTLGRHAESPPLENGLDNPKNKQCFIADARSVLGRETSLISSCCTDLGRILDLALASNAGKKAREMKLSAQDQQTAIVMVRLIGNMIYHCRYNQDLLRITPVPVLDVAMDTSSSNTNSEVPERTGLHVILSATSLAPACFTIREWCIVAIRNAIEGNAANAETVRRLEANQVLDDTPELRRLGVKIDMDAKGNVSVNRRDA